MSDFKEGDKVRAEFVGEIEYVNGDYVEVASGANVMPFRLGDEGVTIAPVGEPTLYERILTTLADRAVGLEAAAKRCDAVERPGLAIEHRTGAEAVRMDLVSVIGLGGVNLDEAISRANALIAEAAKRHG